MPNGNQWWNQGAYQQPSWQQAPGAPAGGNISPQTLSGWGPVSPYGNISASINQGLQGIHTPGLPWAQAGQNFGMNPSQATTGASAQQYGQAAQGMLPTLLSQGPMLTTYNQFGGPMSAPNPFYQATQQQQQYQAQQQAQTFQAMMQQLQAQLQGQTGIAQMGGEQALQQIAAQQQSQMAQLQAQAEAARQMEELRSRLAMEELAKKSELAKQLLEEQWGRFQGLGMGGGDWGGGTYSLAGMDVEPLRRQAEAETRSAMNRYAGGTGSRRRELEGIGRSYQTGLAGAMTGARRAAGEERLAARGQNISLLSQLLRSAGL